MRALTRLPATSWLLSFRRSTSFNRKENTEQWLISIIRTSPIFSGVWVFCEQRQGDCSRPYSSLISEARKLADDMGTEVCGLLLGGKGVGEKMAKELGAYGADKVLVCESDLLETYTTDAYAKVLCDTVMAKKPEILLIAATNIGRDLGPRCAARLHTGLTRRLHPPRRRRREVRCIPAGCFHPAAGSDRCSEP